MTEATSEKIMMTAEAFKALPESPYRRELINGELIIHTYGDDEMHSAPKDVHQETSVFILAFLLKFFPPYELRTAPTEIYLDASNIFQPDIFWFDSAKGSCIRGDDGYLYGAPDLAVEILSPSTAHRDKGVKYDAYEQHGVREYWLVDADLKLIEVYIRINDLFKRLGVFGVSQTFVSPLLAGQTVDVQALFPR